MLQTGTNLGHYQILRSLGAGGMADVYEAQDTRLGRRVALKILPPELGRNPQLVARFEKEVRAAALLNHRNIVTVFEVGEQDGNHYYAMRLLTGGDLRARINRGIKPLEALAILRELSDAFAHAHARGFVHRDVKPENIVFDEQGFPVLTDFGIAKALDADTKMTGTGVAIGTPRYISPEQARGRPVDARADLYSLGAVLYEMLTGSPPYDADEPMAVILKHVSEPVPKLPAPLAYLQSLIDKTMAKEPDQRVASAAELVAMIDALQPRVRTAETASSAATMQNPLVANFLTPSPLHPTPAPAAAPAAAPAGPRLGPARRKQVATYAAAGVAAVIGVALIAIPALHREETAPPAAAAVPADAPAPAAEAEISAFPAAAPQPGADEAATASSAAAPTAAPAPPVVAETPKAAPAAAKTAPAARPEPRRPREAAAATPAPATFRMDERLPQLQSAPPPAPAKPPDTAADEARRREAADQARREEEARAAEAQKQEEQRKREAAAEQARREDEARRQAEAQKLEEQRKREAAERAKRDDETRSKAEAQKQEEQRKREAAEQAKRDQEARRQAEAKRAEEERRRAAAEAAKRDLRDRPVEMTVSPEEGGMTDPTVPPQSVENP